ncbi:MAG: phosphatase PAP2 family protein [Candidatus Heimdallarchaeota archaeon]
MSWFFGEVVNEWFQNTFPWMKWPFKIITFLGDPIVYIIILAIAFWILNKKDAIIAIYVLLTASFLNFFLKVVIQKPRPNVTRLTSADGFSTPSGHAQTSTTVYGWIMFYFKKIWLYVVVPILVILICLSRVFLGVHYIGDVILGLLIGAAVLAALFFGIPLLVKWLDKLKDWQKILIGESYGVVVFLMTFLTGYYANWPAGDTTNSANTVAALILFPFFIWIENKKIGMKNEGIDWRSKLLRAIVGFAVIIGAYFGFSALFDAIIELIPSIGYGLAYLFRFIKYGLLITILGLLMPFVFSRVKWFSLEKPKTEEMVEETSTTEPTT